MSSTDAHVFNPEGHPPLAASYSHISVAPLGPTTKIVSLAGQVGVDSKTGKAAETFVDQLKVALTNVDKCLAAAGIGKKDILSYRQYVVRMSQLTAEDRKGQAETIAEWMGDLPARPGTLIGVESLATQELLVEVEVLAVKN